MTGPAATRLLAKPLALALGMTLLAAGIGGLAYAAMAGQDHLSGVLRPELMALFGQPTDTTAQIRGYAAALLALLGLTALGIGFGRRLPPLEHRWVPWLERGCAAALLALALLWLVLLPASGSNALFWGDYSMHPTIGRMPALRGLVVGFVGLALLMLAACKLATGAAWARWLPLGLLALAVLDAVALVLPGLLAPMRLEGLDFNSMLSMDAHFGTLLGDRLQLREGYPSVLVVEPRYGFLLPVLAAVGERLFGAMDLGQNVRLVQWSQVALLLLFGAAMLVQARGAWAGAAVALLALAPWLSSHHLGIFHPNQAGYRFLGFGVALLALAWVIRGDCLGRPRRHLPWLLGAVAGLALLLNYETGVAVGAGTVVLLALRQPAAGWWRALIATGWRYAAALVAVHLAFWALAWAALGQRPQPLVSLFWPLFDTNVEAAFGLPLIFDPWVMVMGACAAVALVSAGLAHRQRPVGATARLLAAVGAMLLVWLAYWFSRPHLWNSWSYFILFGPFIVEWLRPERLRRHAGLLRRRRLAPQLLVLALVVLPATYLMQRHNLPTSVRQLAARPAAGAERLSGAWFSPEMAAALRGKAAGISAAAATGPVAYVSTHAFSLAVLTGRPLPLKVRDPVFGLKTALDLSNYVRALLALAPAQILVDAEVEVARMPVPMRATLDQIEQALAAGYRFDRVADGWRVLVRRPPG